MKKQHGFTLVETLIVVGLTSIITIGAVLTIHQILVNTNIGNSRVVALDDISRVIVQIKRDLQSYQSGNFTNLKNSPTRMEWTNLSGFESLEERDHYVIYSLSGKTLSREADNETSILGRYIELLSFIENNGTVEVEITATSENFPPRSETFVFDVHQRISPLDDE